MLRGVKLSFSDVIIGIGIGVVTAVITTGVTFYVKDSLRERELSSENLRQDSNKSLVRTPK